MEVDNIEIDLYNFNNYDANNQRFYHGRADYQLVNKYIDENTYSILVRRLDKNEGWGNNLQVLVVYLDNETTSVIDIGNSSSPEKEIIVMTDFKINMSTTKMADFLPTYNLIECPDPIAISRDEFNSLFDTDIVRIPSHLYAYGLADGKIYVYSEFYIMYHETINQVKHILKIALTFTPHYNKFYFLFCICDGYMEAIYHNNRTVPKHVTNEDFTHGVQINDNEYPIYHKRKYIIGQSTDIGMPYTLGTVDRHYLYCDLYNPFRSFHKGIKFDTKINKIISGCRRERSHKYNFLKRRDIDIAQREYFYSDAISKENVVCPPGWIHDYEMIKYKYILDIDGNGCTWDATAWKLNSGSVIFKTESRWRQWFYDDYLPWVHYVPINDDFSNLQEMYCWCEQNQDKCEEIIKNAKQLFQKAYSFHSVIKYTVGLLDKLNCIIE